MSITNSQAAPYGLLLMYAMDMYNALPAPRNILTPPPDPRITAAGWTVIAYLTGQDAIFRGDGSIGQAGRVYYGFLAQNMIDPTQCVVAVRGTNGLVEWVEDAEFVPIAYPPYPALSVEQGFWGIYASMTLVRPDGSSVGGKAADGLAVLVQNNNLMVIGHSLGSSLATYLSLDAARGPLGKRVSACLFASPRTGNAAFTKFYDATLNDYRVFNYVLDLVPRVPAGPDYATLPCTTVLQPATSEASIRVDILCNHHVIDYVAMLDYELSQAPGVVVTPDDQQCAACILGPETAGWTMAKELASLANLVT